ncbi:MAG: transporter, permease protein [Myxococcales bacterium]|nr:transporter, permease protein [Myxococcales bacterium]
MRNTMAIAKREFKSYVNSPIPYILVTAYIATAGYMFFQQLFIVRQADMRHFFDNMPLLFCLIVPFVTMRLVAEERREGTLELLLTMPVTDWQLVFGKFLAALGLMSLLLVLTLAFPITVAALGPLDKGTTVAGYIGAILMSGAFVAIGIMASSFTRNQIVAALVAFFIGFGLFLIGALIGVLPPSLAPVASALSIGSHFQNISRGVIDSRDFLYYVSIIFVCLLVAQTTLDSRRWR